MATDNEAPAPRTSQALLDQRLRVEACSRKRHQLPSAQCAQAGVDFQRLSATRLELSRTVARSRRTFVNSFATRIKGCQALAHSRASRCWQVDQRYTVIEQELGPGAIWRTLWQYLGICRCSRCVALVQSLGCGQGRISGLDRAVLLHGRDDRTRLFEDRFITDRDNWSMSCSRRVYDKCRPATYRNLACQARPSDRRRAGLRPVVEDGFGVSV